MINDIYIKATTGGVSRSTAKLMKTGQTISYRTGDDGDFEAGRNTSFLVLAENNPFGNTNRFTSELGTQTYTNNIVIDWSTYDGATVLGWRRTTSIDITWDNAIDGALATSIGTFTTGWRLPNIQEILSIVNFMTSAVFSYSPFNLPTTSYRYWTGTTGISSLNAYQCTNGAGLVSQIAKTNNASVRYFPCRVFTVTGTTLT